MLLTVRYDSGEEDELDAGHFFRSERELESLEHEALRRCAGPVLDVGACCGALTLPLQARGCQVTALEVLPEAVEVMRDRGIERTVLGDLWTVELPGRFQTVLAIMNGTGLAGTAGRLASLIDRLGLFAVEGGQILIDSQDLRDTGDPGDGRYPGEVQLQFGYQDRFAAPFPHLFADPELLEEACREVGWKSDIVARDLGDRFLARLTRA